MKCRICYDDGAEDSPVLNLCACKEETGAMHQSCLTTWIRVSKRLRCEVCRESYKIPDLVMESNYKPTAMVLWLATYPYFVFSESLLMYTAYVLSHASSYDSIYITIMDAIPYSLIIVIAAQALVMGPAIAKIRDKGRYLHYMCSAKKHPITPYPLIIYHVMAGAWFGLAWIFPALSSPFFLFIISQFYDFHCSLIKHINCDALTAFLTDEVSLTLPVAVI